VDFTTTPEIAATCEALARSALASDHLGVAVEAMAVLRAMPGLRQGPGDQLFLESVAWLHMAVESGNLDRDQVGLAGVPEHIRLGVQLLHRAEWMTDHWYARQIVGAPELVRIVFVCVALAERAVAGRGGDERRKRALVTRAEHWVIPIAEDLAAPWGPWFSARLREPTR
jgi:hypothetical protein